jgi:ribosomal-protein-alanine N-acetyltransferase
MRFRSYAPSDIEAMVQLDVLCFTEAFQFDRLTMQQFAEEPAAITVLAEQGRPSVLVAFTILHLEYRLDDFHAYVVTIDVAPGHRRSGIGASMLEKAESIARSAGARQITLHVAADNSAAIAFYEHQHYHRTGLAKRFYREAQQDALIFAKPL